MVATLLAALSLAYQFKTANVCLDMDHPVNSQAFGAWSNSSTSSKRRSIGIFRQEGGAHPRFGESG